MFEAALRELLAYDTIIIHRHKNPDGDAIGSQSGLFHIIKDNFPEKKVYRVGEASTRYAFIEGASPDVIPDICFDGALSVILDTPVPALIDDSRYTLAARRLRIDHHLFCTRIAETEIVDCSYESCCGLITAFAEECSLEISKDAATALYTGMVTDSGRFRFDSTSPRTFTLAASLLRTGVDICDIYRHLYSESFDSIKLRAAFISKIKLTEHNVAYIYSTKEDVAATGLSLFSVSRGMVGTMSDIKGVDIHVNFTESDDGVLCELRSDNRNINKIAVKYGGGGHIKASGATVRDYNEAMQMLNDLDLLAASENDRTD